MNEGGARGKHSDLALDHKGDTAFNTCPNQPGIWSCAWLLSCHWSQACYFALQSQVQGSRYDMQVLLHGAGHLAGLCASQADQFKPGWSVQARLISASQADTDMCNQALPLPCPQAICEFKIHLNMHKQASAVVNYVQ